jgi:hypothetical protein
LDAKKDHETKDIYIYIWTEKWRQKKGHESWKPRFLKPKSAQNSAILLASLTMVGIRCQ